MEEFIKNPSFILSVAVTLFNIAFNVGVMITQVSSLKTKVDDLEQANKEQQIEDDKRFQLIEQRIDNSHLALRQDLEKMNNTLLQMLTGMAELRVKNEFALEQLKKRK